MTADPDVPQASEALLRPVRPGNAFEDTVGRLLQTIRLGVLHPANRCRQSASSPQARCQPRHGS